MVLTDSNGHLGSACSNAVGTAGAESENKAGAAFHDFLISLGLCLPTTFAEIHQEEHLTWKVGSPSGHRLDYIAVPEEWFTGELTSRVWYDFDHVHDVDDHQPVLLSCELARSASHMQARASVKAPRPQVDTDPGQLQCFQYAIEALPKVNWHVDVDMHYSAFVRSTIWCWSEFVKPVPRRRCKPFVPEETLATVEHRKQVRRFLTTLAAALKHVRILTGLFAFWLQWQHVEPNTLQVQYLEEMLRSGRLSVASAVGCLGRLRISLRKAIRRDRATYLRRLAGEIAESSLQQPKQLQSISRRQVEAQRRLLSTSGGSA